MTFNSVEFLIFFPIVALLYFLLPRRARWPMLLIASYYFYMFYEAELVFLIFGTTLISWVSSLVIEKTEKKGVKRLFLTLTLVACLGTLFVYKYLGFLFESFLGIAELLGFARPDIVIDLVLPVGISFYTFQTLSYVIDVYRGKIQCEKNFFFYALFVSFFPQLVAGPIERPDNLIPQLREEHKFDKDNFSRGIRVMLLGFFKKICVADLLSVYVTEIYNAPDGATGLGVILATVLFAVEIYCDFSGYTDIATGCARIMGIRLMKNFDHPYTAVSVKDFWSRWHISLSSWFRDYLYIPLGGNRTSRPRHLFNLFFVFLVSGLWHGANWTFVIWGALHGVYQIVGNLTRPARDRLLTRCGLDTKGAVVVNARRVVTFFLVTFAWLLFRANSISDAIALLSKVFCDFGGVRETLGIMGLGAVELLTVLFAIVSLLFIDRLVDYSENDSADALTKNGSFVYYVYIVMIVWIFLLSRGIESTFIYFRF